MRGGKTQAAREMLDAVLADGTIVGLPRRKGGPLVSDPMFIGGQDFNGTPQAMTVLRVTWSESRSSLRRALDFGALEYFENGYRLVEEGPTEGELAAIESVVEARASRCITGSAAQSCGAPS